MEITKVKPIEPINKEPVWFVDAYEELVVDINDISCVRKKLDEEVYQMVMKSGQLIRVSKYTYSCLVRFIRDRTSTAKGEKNGND